MGQAAQGVDGVAPKGLKAQHTGEKIFPRIDVQCGESGGAGQRMG